MDAKVIYVVSDSTGETAERVTRATLLQFPEHSIRLKLERRVRDRRGLTAILENAAAQGAMVVFTLVRPELRDHFNEEATKLGVRHVDVIGSLIRQVGQYLKADPVNIPTAEMPLSEEYFRRVEAIEFAVKSDDGKEPRNLHKADLVLVGVSRTSKTPLSTYLAGRGLKIANVPLVLGVDPPSELYELPGYRVVGLTVDVDQLTDIRGQRLQQLGMPSDASYGLRDHVKAELEYAHDIFREHSEWMVVDVTNCAIEETATIILEALKEREELKGLTSPAPRVL
ncbi:MAG: kinase/pyrophosphorylase [Deltaproteobacteria bacterium]|nr:kinase/pyrophosphorylase [Deltaproteobacteria bacterium]MBW2224254.1 kinase/pyrophosphorylase [Deltaproteobacteria bacterium]MBW2718694.1 kinase/pyrophosphorylase [Deltaproteobacteria bacterium]RLB50396.1 MAG: kinase/pyrophosphorylase [Deltaproteobacteria bacterium]